jgi:hypothetical protein
VARERSLTPACRRLLSLLIIRTMPIDPDALTSLAGGYAKGMTSIRGRRVQRLLKREFAGADYVLVLQLESGAAAVLGLSARGAALCATDGRGKHASVVKWLHGSTEALETRFDLLKDSLPALGTRAVPLAGVARPAHLQASGEPSEARALMSMALRALA